jgi:hypothetical protein
MWDALVQAPILQGLGLIHIHVYIYTYVCVCVFIDNIRKKDTFEVITVVAANIAVVWGVTSYNFDRRLRTFQTNLVLLYQVILWWQFFVYGAAAQIRLL